MDTLQLSRNKQFVFGPYRGVQTMADSLVRQAPVPCKTLLNLPGRAASEPLYAFSGQVGLDCLSGGHIPIYSHYYGNLL